MWLSRAHCCCARIALATSFWLTLSQHFLCSQPPSAQSIDEEITRQKQIAERFLTVLERNPRRGTALDRTYGFHVENGTLESFLKDLRSRVSSTPTDGVAWMILGLLESQRSRDAAAVEAFT